MTANDPSELTQAEVDAFAEALAAQPPTIRTLHRDHYWAGECPVLQEGFYVAGSAGHQVYAQALDADAPPHFPCHCGGQHPVQEITADEYAEAAARRPKASP